MTRKHLFSILVFLMLCVACGGKPAKPHGTDSVPVFVPRGPAQTQILTEARANGIAGAAYYREGQYQKAKTEYEAAVRKLTLIDNYIEIGRVRLNLALIHIKLKEWSEAEAGLAAAGRIFAGKKLPEDQARAVSIRGQLHEARGELDRALQAYQEALLILQQGQADLRDVSEQLGNIGYIQYRKQNDREAIRWLLQAVSLADRIRFYDHLPEYYTWLGEAQLRTGKPEIAANYFFNALTADKAAENPAGIATDLSNLGRAHLAQGKYAEAAQYLERAIGINTALRRTERVLRDLGLLLELAQKTGDNKRELELREFIRKLKAGQPR